MAERQDTSFELQMWVTAWMADVREFNVAAKIVNAGAGGLQFTCHLCYLPAEYREVIDLREVSDSSSMT
jgi:hypothetical protein